MAINHLVTINGRSIGNGFRPYIIAEMACAHNGDLEQARKLIDAASDAESDAVQLQFFTPELTVTPHHEAFKTLKKIAFTKDQWRQLFEYGKAKGLDVWVCTYDMPSVEWAKEFGADGIKLNSADLSNPEIVSAVSASSIPFTLGTGASTLDEIRNGMKLAEESGAKDIILMHGVQNFPTEINNLNISRLRFLKENFSNIPCGYADHTDAEDEFSKVVDLVAVGLEANLIEKHITLDRSGTGIDFQAALEPQELRAFVSRIQCAYRAFGNDSKQEFTDSDLRYRKFQKKSIVAGRDLKPGERITRNDVEFLRNDNPGVPPIEMGHFIGKTVKNSILKYQNISKADLN